MSAIILAFGMIIEVDSEEFGSQITHRRSGILAGVCFDQERNDTHLRLG